MLKEDSSKDENYEAGISNLPQVYEYDSDKQYWPQISFISLLFNEINGSELNMRLMRLIFTVNALNELNSLSLMEIVAKRSFLIFLHKSLIFNHNPNVKTYVVHFDALNPNLLVSYQESQDI